MIMLLIIAINYFTLRLLLHQPVLGQALVLRLEGLHVVQKPHPQLFKGDRLAPADNELLIEFRILGRKQVL